MTSKKSIEFRCTDDERLVYETAAKQAGLSLSAWIKGKLGHEIPVRTADATPRAEGTPQSSETATLDAVRTNENAIAPRAGDQDSIAPPIGKIKCNPAMQKFLNTQPAPPPVQQKVKIPDWLGDGFEKQAYKSDPRKAQVKCYLK